MGPVLPDPRWLPIDMAEGKCKGSCKVGKTKRSFARTKPGSYHK